MPARFDRATVAQMLADIDKPNNASILKVGYFLRRGQPELPVEAGFELLQTVAGAEPVGTNKWFRLQNLLAVVAFRVPGVDTDAGFEAYRAIFDHASEAALVKADYPLRQSILEFVDSVPGKFNDLGLSRDERTKELLLRAWTAYATALSAPASGGVVAEPDWKRALTKAGALEAFVPAVEKVLADPAVRPSFGLLLTAAAVLAPTQPGKALELWQRAKPLVPRGRDGKADVNEAARLYSPLVDALAAPDALPAAIENQREFVALTGRGQAKLMLLLRKSGDEAATTRLLSELLEVSTDEREIGDAASGLFKLSRDAKAPDVLAGEQAVKLLLSYLAAPRPRSLVEEIGARLSLGNFYLRAKRWDEAIQILRFEPPQQPDARVKSLLRDVERMKERAQKASEK